MKPTSVSRELNKVQAHLNHLYAFFQAYPKLQIDEASITYANYADSPTFYLTDAVLCGDVLGKDGWTREIGNSGFNWTQSFLGVKVVILDAEEIAASPVSPKAFPLALEESSPSSTVLGDSSPQTEKEEIPF